MTNFVMIFDLESAEKYVVVYFNQLCEIVIISINDSDFWNRQQNIWLNALINRVELFCKRMISVSANCIKLYQIYGGVKKKINVK